MATPDSQGLFLSDAPKVDVLIERTGSEIGGVLPVEIYDIIFLMEGFNDMIIFRTLRHPDLYSLILAS
jgi:hypothetical protein